MLSPLCTVLSDHYNLSSQCLLCIPAVYVLLQMTDKVVYQYCHHPGDADTLSDASLLFQHALLLLTAVGGWHACSVCAARLYCIVIITQSELDDCLKCTGFHAWRLFHSVKIIVNKPVHLSTLCPSALHTQTNDNVQPPN